MTVTTQLLSALVDAHENSQKLTDLKRELIIASGASLEPRAYRFGEYNIQVTTVPWRAVVSHVTILRAQELTPQPEATCEPLNAASVPMHGDKVPGNVECAERRAVKEALHILQGGFAWDYSSKGRPFWVNLTNQLRDVVGAPRAKY